MGERPVTEPRDVDRETLARLQWFVLTGDVKQWSGPTDESPLPGMQRDLAALMHATDTHPSQTFELGEVRDG